VNLRRHLALGLALAVCGFGCVASPPDPDPLTAVPVDEVRDRPGERPLRHATVRVRNLGCGFIATGSGVVVGDGLIATNRHVVDGACRLEINI
jgi:S1-C subfamily serine protease